MRWDEFGEACPRIARRPGERFAEDQLVMLGTLRADGWPRISPCEADVAQGHLLLGMMWLSRKAVDLLRDPRIVERAGYVVNDDGTQRAMTWDPARGVRQWGKPGWEVRRRQGGTLGDAYQVVPGVFDGLSDRGLIRQWFAHRLDLTGGVVGRNAPDAGEARQDTLEAFLARGTRHTFNP